MSEGSREVNPFEDGSAAGALRGLPVFEEALARLLHTAEHGRPFAIVRGPAGTTVLVRHVEVDVPLDPWRNGFGRPAVTHFHFRASKRPWIGVSPDSDPTLLDFLKQQGYWVESSPDSQAYSIYLHQPKFTPEDERPMLRQLAQSEAPLICLGRWPDGAQSAMCVTGDIDALTLWDYGLRFLGN